MDLLTGKQSDGGKWSNNNYSWGDEDEGWAEPGAPDADFSSWGMPSQGGSGWGDSEKEKSEWPSVGDQSENTSDTGDDSASQHSGSVISSSSNQGRNDMLQGSNAGQSSGSSMQGSNSVAGNSWGMGGGNTAWGHPGMTPNAKYNKGLNMQNVSSDNGNAQNSQVPAIRGSNGINGGNSSQNNQMLSSVQQNSSGAHINYGPATSQHTIANKGWKDLNMTGGVGGTGNSNASKSTNGWNNIPENSQHAMAHSGTENNVGSQWPTGGASSGWGDNKPSEWGSTSASTVTGPSGTDWNKTCTAVWGTSVNTTTTSSSQPQPPKSPNTWAQAAGKGLNKTSESNKQQHTQQQNKILQADVAALINSTDGWGKMPVNQSSGWGDAESPEPDSKTGVGMWKAHLAAKHASHQQNTAASVADGATAWGANRTASTSSTGSSASGWGEAESSAAQWNNGASSAPGAPSTAGQQWRRSSSSSSWGTQESHPSSNQWGPSAPNNETQWGAGSSSQTTAPNWSDPPAPDEQIIPTGK